MITTEQANEIIDLLQAASQHTMSATKERLKAAGMWREVCRWMRRASELDALRSMLHLVDLTVAESRTLENLSSRLSSVEKSKAVQGIASDAAALAIDSGDLPQAISLLEQGRSIIYAQLGRYRSTIDDVRRVSPELAASLADLSVELDALVVRGERINSKSNVMTQPSDDDTSR